ncbi:sigma-E factor negative regulatory protein [Craterilacuibacter sp.]|uniref:sigma-E factor negative regulatory protein n=1 Tax=Craterilacuibacter sp. TaxID=2870909 RepID=UPI003F2F0A7D
MKENLSALMDGELDDMAGQRAIDEIQQDAALKDSWDMYHLIGEAMRDGPALTLDVRHEVGAALVAEPTVLAPRGHWHKPALKMRHYAMAASMAFAAAVGWVGWQQNEPPLVVAKATEIQVFSPVDAVDAPYLLAHQEMAGDIDSGLKRVAYGAAGTKVAH